MSLSKGELETLCRKQSHARLKERLLLVLKIEGDRMIPTLLVLQEQVTGLVLIGLSRSGLLPPLLIYYYLLLS
ncbi:MAG: hypothetical protein WCF46_15000 [Nitrososphaeraceae archaeon]